MAQSLRSGKDTEQSLVLETHSDEALSPDSGSGHDEDPAAADCDSNAGGSEVYVWSRPQHTHTHTHTRNSCSVHPFTGGPFGLRM
jgi:hypothetical protein